MRTVVRNSYTPQTGDYCNKIVVDEDKGVQYIFDSDGVFSVYTSKQQEGAPMFYVDSAVNAAKNELKTYADTKDAQVLQEAKDYADTHSGGVSQTYVDTQDQAILAEAKAYTDEHGGGGSETELFFITATSIDDTNHTFTADKTYAEALEAYTAGKLLVLKYVSLGADDGEYTFIPLSYYIDFDEGTGFVFQSSHTDGGEGRVHASNEDFFLSRYSNQNTYYHGSGSVEIDSTLDVYATSSHTISNSAVATALQTKANSADLATVATSGSYVDLTNKPTIPVVTLSNTDIAEGSALPANNFYGVYIEESE